MIPFYNEKKQLVLLDISNNYLIELDIPPEEEYVDMSIDKLITKSSTDNTYKIYEISY